MEKFALDELETAAAVAAELVQGAINEERRRAAETTWRGIVYEIVKRDMAAKAE